MRVTTRKSGAAAKWTPALWDVLVDGRTIGTSPHHSEGRVLKSPWGYMPILDGAAWGPVAYATRGIAARAVAEKARKLGRA